MGLTYNTVQSVTKMRTASLSANKSSLDIYQANHTPPSKARRLRRPQCAKLDLCQERDSNLETKFSCMEKARLKM